MWLKDGSEPPGELEMFLLCERFHKLPSEVRRENLANILDLLEVMTAIDEMREANRGIS